MAIVPTIYIDNTRWFFQKVLLTNQYAVTEHQRTLNVQHPDAFPGIFINYALEPISVRITARKHGFVQFITRFCGIIGGVYVTLGILVTLGKWFSKHLSEKNRAGYRPISR